MASNPPLRLAWLVGLAVAAACATEPQEVANVTVRPAADTVRAGHTVNLTATTSSADGNVLPGPMVTWATNDPLVATVDASGVVTGMSHGKAVITATSGGQTGASDVTVWVGATGSWAAARQHLYRRLRCGLPDPTRLQSSCTDRRSR